MVDYKKIKIPFGAYVQAHNKPVQKNSLMPRTLDCVYLKSFYSPYAWWTRNVTFANKLDNV